MDLSSKKIIKQIFKDYGIKPSKKLGQNFLINKSVVKKIIESADLKQEDIVLEIGPGIGALTRETAPKVKKVIAVEKDEKMCEILCETMKGINNVEIINEDILKIKPQIPISNDQSSPKSQFTKPYKIISNLPFYLTAVIIRRFLEEKKPPREMVLVVQKEVGQRICAKPPHMNLLAVSVQFYSNPKIIDYVSKQSFWPEPEVDAAIINLKIKSEKLKVNRELFFKIVRAGFIHPRKIVLNNFIKGLKINKQAIENWLAKNNINPIQRAESLTVQDWLNLSKSFDSK